MIADTNLISYDLRDDPIAFEYERLLEGYAIHISFMTVAELIFWSEKNNWGPGRRTRLRVLLDTYPVFPYSREVAEIFARIRLERDRAGRPMLSPDGWIAATAIHFGVPLATHDGNFVGTPGLQIISADPKVCALRDEFVEARRALDLNLRCGCGM